MASRVEERTLLCTRCNYEFVLPINPEVPIESFRSFSLPTQSDFALQSQLLQEEISILERCNEQIVEIKVTLSRLESNRLALLGRMAKRRALLSSLRKVPVEIWEQIFVEACLQDESTMRVPDPLKINHNSFRGMPLTLSRTCTSWQQIARSIPYLWSCIELEIPPMLPSNYPLVPIALRFVLDRAHDSPLNLTILYEGYDKPLFPATLTDLLLQALSSSRELEVKPWVLKMKNLICIPFLPRLESFTLIDDGSYSHREDVRIILQHAPALKSLVLPRLTHWIPSESYLSIQSLECSFTSGILTIPSSFPCLRAMVVDFDQDSDEHIDDPSVVEFPALTSLTCRIYTRPSYADPSSLEATFTFLDNVALPSLASLILNVVSTNNGIERHYYSDHEVGGPIINCIERSNCGRNLKSLKMTIPMYDLAQLGYDEVGDQGWLLRLLDLAPRLEILSLEVSSLARGEPIFDTNVHHLLGRLNSKDPAVPFPFPSLREFSIGILNLIIDEDSTVVLWGMIDQFLRVLEYRMASHLPLTRAELSLGDYLGSHKGKVPVKDKGNRWCEVLRRVNAVETGCGTKCVVYAPDLI